MAYLLLGFYVAGAIAVVWALVEAIRVPSWRWASTIVLFPVLGAIAWFVAGRRFYKNGHV